jgi:hypothetical protein
MISDTYFWSLLLGRFSDKSSFSTATPVIASQILRQSFCMAEWREIAKLLDSCHSLFLHEIGEPRENVLPWG